STTITAAISTRCRSCARWPAPRSCTPRRPSRTSGTISCPPRTASWPSATSPPAGASWDTVTCRARGRWARRGPSTCRASPTSTANAGAATWSTWAAWGSRGTGTRARPMRCGTPRRAAWRSAASCTITRPRAARSWTPACRAFSPTAWRRAPEAGRMPHRLREAALLAGSAVALALAFPRADWDMAAWFALVPLLLVALETAPRIAFAWGWLYGLTFFLVLLRWLDFTFRTYSEIPWPLTWGVVFLLSAWCGLYVAAVAGLVSLIARRGSPAWALATAPCLWVGAEWLRGHFLGGFPWGTLGYSQYLRLTVSQVAELGGVHAVSFVLVAVNAALAGALVLSWRRALGGVALAV